MLTVAVRVRLMNEYTIEWPLWVPDGPTREGDLPVSEAVAREIKAWARTFNEHYDWESGWDDQEIAEGHVREASRLEAALAADLGDEYEVALELWEAPAAK